MKGKKRNRKNGDNNIGVFSSNYLDATRVVCKCGHRVNFISKIPYIECTHCHNIIFRNRKAEYDYKIKRRFASCKNVDIKVENSYDGI